MNLSNFVPLFSAKVFLNMVSILPRYLHVQKSAESDAGVKMARASQNIFCNFSIILKFISYKCFMKFLTLFFNGPPDS